MRRTEKTTSQSGQTSEFSSLQAPLPLGPEYNYSLLQSFYHSGMCLTMKVFFGGKVCFGFSPKDVCFVSLVSLEQTLSTIKGFLTNRHRFEGTCVKALRPFQVLFQSHDIK